MKDIIDVYFDVLEENSQNGQIRIDTDNPILYQLDKIITIGLHKRSGFPLSNEEQAIYDKYLAD